MFTCFESIKNVYTLLVFVVSTMKHNCSLLSLLLQSFIKNKTRQPGNFIFKFQFKIKHIISLHAKTNTIISIFPVLCQAWKLLSFTVKISGMTSEDRNTTYHISRVWATSLAVHQRIREKVNVLPSFLTQYGGYSSSSLIMYFIFAPK